MNVMSKMTEATVNSLYYVEDIIVGTQKKIVVRTHINKYTRQTYIHSCIYIFI